MEQKLDGIFALLKTGKMAALSEAAQSPVPIETPPAPKVTGPVLNSGLKQQLLTETSFPNSIGGMTPSLGHPPSFGGGLWKVDTQDVFDKGFLTLKEGDRLLSMYRPYKSNFPFVVILPHVSLEALRRDKPFTLLAILCVTSLEDLKLQGRLEGELRETLSRKVIINGEKGLDLLQGLMLYLSWWVPMETSYHSSANTTLQ
jgi:hypothetical protein